MPFEERQVAIIRAIRDPENGFYGLMMLPSDPGTIELVAMVLLDAICADGRLAYLRASAEKMKDAMIEENDKATARVPQ